MPKNKETLILHYGLLEDFEYMTKEQIADFIIAIFRYEIYGEKPEFKDRLLYPYFQNIARVLDNNKIKYDEKCEKNKSNAKLRWEREKNGSADECERINKNANAYFSMPKNADNDKEKEEEKEKDNDNVYVNEKDNIIPSGDDSSATHTHKKQYGIYSNILLNEDQFEEFKSLHPTDYQQRIDSMSSYMKAQGKTYNDNYARLCSWKLLDKEEPKHVRDDTPSYDIDAYMRQSLELTYPS